MRRIDRATAAATACALIALAATAVASAGRSTSTHTLRVELKEMSVAVSAKSVAAGKVTFEVKNLGAVDHELVIMRSPASGKLKLSHFKVDEATLVAEVHDVAPGKTGRGTFALKPGKYFLICNIVGHYQLGMAAALNVVSAGG